MLKTGKADPKSISQKKLKELILELEAQEKIINRKLVLLPRPWKQNQVERVDVNIKSGSTVELKAISIPKVKPAL